MTDMAISQLKSQVASRMKEAGQAAIFWSKGAITVAGYPLIDDVSGRTHIVYGLALTPGGHLEAIISLPHNIDLSGVLVLREGQRLPPPDSMSADGSDAQWAVLCDCYDNAMHALRGRDLADAPLPWW